MFNLLIEQLLRELPAVEQTFELRIVDTASVLIAGTIR